MTNRRAFLRGAAGALAIAPLSAQGGKIKFGLIGAGWYGMVDVKAAFKAGGVECVGICDIDSDHLNAAADEVEKLQGSRPKLFKNYQELLDVDGMDAVIIGTPPHWHALQFIAACGRGLDVYCEKPLSYDIREGRAMVDAWRHSGNIAQIGFQRRQNANFRAAREYIQAGKAGRIVQADVNIHYKANPGDNTPQDPPPSLDWDSWSGPGPKIPYSPNVGHKSWRLEKTSGNGHLVDWGIHLIDTLRLTLQEGMPKSVTATGGLYQLKGKITTPDTLTAVFEFDDRPVVWRHRLWGAAEYDPSIANGILFFGEKETIFANDNRWEIIPQGKNAEKKVMEEKGTHPGTAQVAEFLQSVRSRKQPSCPPDEGWVSTATVQLAMISYNTGSRIDWDVERERIPNNAAANKLLKRDYRAPYVHPYKG
jgi:predicted dehydrogenase